MGYLLPAASRHQAHQRSLEAHAQRRPCRVPVEAGAHAVYHQVPDDVDPLSRNALLAEFPLHPRVLHHEASEAPDEARRAVAVSDGGVAQPPCEERGMHRVATQVQHDARRPRHQGEPLRDDPEKRVLHILRRRHHRVHARDGRGHPGLTPAGEGAWGHHHHHGEPVECGGDPRLRRA